MALKNEGDSTTKPKTPAPGPVTTPPKLSDTPVPVVNDPGAIYYPSPYHYTPGPGPSNPPLLSDTPVPIVNDSAPIQGPTNKQPLLSDNKKVPVVNDGNVFSEVQNTAARRREANLILDSVSIRSGAWE